jgi:periplasmic copper chaperone A
MKKNAILSVAVVALSALATAVATTQEYKANSIEVDQPWSTATPRGADVAAGYLTIKNTGTQPDRLTGASSPVAGKVEVHEMTMENGIMRMRPLSSGLEIKPGQTVELKPNSFHLMLENLKEPIQQGRPFKATLTFAKAGSVDVDFAVVPIGASTGRPLSLRSLAVLMSTVAE